MPGHSKLCAGKQLQIDEGSAVAVQKVNSEILSYKTNKIDIGSHKE